ncbi:MHFG family PEP-CTERM protein [Burkholderiaceae bacterium UC74_6]
MSLLATLALASSGVTLPVCSWDHPGVNPFMGDVVSAVDRYADIPAATRAKLKERMARRDYDEIALIERDRITGMAQYAPEITSMHFGQGGVCKTVSRAKWTDKMQERGLVYCEDGQCILVPTICRNVSRIRRTGEAPLSIAPAAGGTPPGEATPDQPLAFDPPAAGAPAPGAPGSFANPGPSVAPSSFTPVGSSPLSGGPTTAPPIVPPVQPPGTLPPGAPTITTPAVPEPGTWMTLLAGLAAVAVVSRRRQIRQH